MSYWFDENAGTAFAMEVPPPDGAGIIEISEEDFTEIVKAASQPGANIAVVEPPPTPTPTMDMERLARIWRKMEDRMDELKAACEAEIATIKTQQDQLSGVLLSVCNSMKADELRTPAGIIQRKEETHANAADWAAIHRFIAENNQFEMIQKRLTTTAVLAWARAHNNELPPGMNLFTKYKINVKKPAATGGKALPSE